MILVSEYVESKKYVQKVQFALAHGERQIACISIHAGIIHAKNFRR